MIINKGFVTMGLAVQCLISSVVSAADLNHISQVDQVELAEKLIRPDRVIVKFKKTRQKSSAIIKDKSNQTGTLFSSLGLTTVKKIQVKKSVIAKSGAGNGLEISVLALDGRQDIKSVLQELNANPLVDYAEPDYIRQLDALPNDPEFSQLWGLHNTGLAGGVSDADIDAPEAWNASTDSDDIVIGVIDTGVDYNHIDLADNIWINPGEIPDDGIDNDHNGYIDDIHGIDCADGDSDPLDADGHGTHVSGVIGAVGNNGIGVSGVVWNTQMMALKIFGDSDPTDSTILECLAYAINMKNNYGINVQITNNSWGGGAFSQAIKDMIEAFADANMLFVAAAGNGDEFSQPENSDLQPHYPSSYDLDNIISVAATDRTDSLASFSNFGLTSVDLGAPGSSILSTTLDDQYEFQEGTSMAAPHVTGAAALLWANNPSLTALEIKNRLMDRGEPLPALSGKTVSGRRLNIHTAMNCIPGNPELKILTPSSQFVVPFGNDVIVTAKLSDCGQPLTNLDVVAVPGDGGTAFILFDDGQEGDTHANDGIYTGVWPLQNTTEPVSLTVIADASGLTETIAVKTVNDYKVDSNHDFQWIDATSGSRLDISDFDDATAYIDIGFNFEFYGVSYSKINVDTNGLLSFFDSNSMYENVEIPNRKAPNALIAPYWDDLSPEVAGITDIYTLLQGVAPNRTLTISWLDFKAIDSFSSDSEITMQVILYEGTNDIIFQYEGAYLADGATIGIEHQLGDYGLQILHNGENDGESVQIQDQQAIRFYLEEEETIDTNAPSIPEGLTLSRATHNEVDIRWTSSTDAEGTVEVYHIFRDGEALGSSTTTSFIDTTVTGNTRYEYQVKAEDDSGNQSALSASLSVETPATPLPTVEGLIAGYAFEEGSSQLIQDVSGNGNHGSLQGGAQRHEQGYYGEAIEFDGINGQVDLGAINVTSSTLSIALWFKADDFGIHDARLLSKSTGTAEQDHDYMLSTIRRSGKYRLRFRLKTTDGGTDTLIGNAALSAGEWTHAVATYDGERMRLYQNGILVGELTKTGSIVTSESPTWIGANPGGTRYFDGLIDEVRIYGEALAASEIEEIMQENLPVIESADRVAPSIPEGLTLSRATHNEVDIRWTPSTDAEGTVEVYHIFRDGEALGSSTTTSFIDTTVTGNTRYEYQVKAEDDSGNQSALSASLSVETPATPLPTVEGLIAGYAFEEGSGQLIQDVSGNGNHGVLQGGAQRHEQGYYGEAIEFDGINGQVDLGAINVTSSTLSIALWFKADDFGIHDARLLSKSIGTAEQDHDYMLSTIRRNGQYRLRFRLKTTDGGTDTLIGNAALSAGEWTHAVATYDGERMRLYQNGIQIGGMIKTGNIRTSEAQTWIGANPGDTRYFDGLIDEVFIYEDALGASEIQEIMQENLPLAFQRK